MVSIYTPILFLSLKKGSIVVNRCMASHSHVNDVIFDHKSHRDRYTVV